MGRVDGEGVKPPCVKTCCVVSGVGGRSDERKLCREDER